MTKKDLDQIRQVVREEIRTEVSSQFDEKFDSFNLEVTSRFDEIDVQFEEISGRFEEYNVRFKEVKKKFEEFNKRFTTIDNKFAAINDRFTKELKPIKSDLAKVRRGLKIVVNYFDHEIVDLRTRVSRLELSLNI